MNIFYNFVEKLNIIYILNIPTKLYDDISQRIQFYTLQQSYFEALNILKQKICFDRYLNSNEIHGITDSISVNNPSYFKYDKR